MPKMESLPTKVCPVCKQKFGPRVHTEDGTPYTHKQIYRAKSRFLLKATYCSRACDAKGRHRENLEAAAKDKKSCEGCKRTFSRAECTWTDSKNDRTRLCGHRDFARRKFCPGCAPEARKRPKPSKPVVRRQPEKPRVPVHVETRMADDAIKRMMSHGHIDVALELSAYIDERRARGIPSTGLTRRVIVRSESESKAVNLKALLTLRQELGWTQVVCADELGISLNALKRYEQGRQPLHNSTAVKLAEVLGMTLREFQAYAD